MLSKSAAFAVLSERPLEIIADPPRRLIKSATELLKALLTGGRPECSLLTVWTQALTLEPAIRCESSLETLVEKSIVRSTHRVREAVQVRFFVEDRSQ